MSDSGPYFYGWCDEADRADALAAALSALVRPGGTCNVDLSTIGISEDVWRDKIPIDEAVAVVRAHFAAGTHVSVYFPVTVSSGRAFAFGVDCFGEGYERRYASGPLRASPFDLRDVYRDLYRQLLEIAWGSGERSVEVEAALLSMQVQEDVEDLLLRLCAPDGCTLVTTGACAGLGDWEAPLEMRSTYHANAAEVARDLALSWVHLYDGDIVGRAARFSLAELAARVEAAPQGARVGVAVSGELQGEHAVLDRAAAKSRDERPTRPDAARRGPRPILPGDVELTREQVLAALAMPPATLLEALEASAVPDEEWRAAEPLALELLEAKKQGAPTYEVNVSTGKHTRFIERHAPYHVRRLPNGGVLLATHPYRTLWPLWADALYLLGIRP
jgi:hypothetical protein